MNESSIYKSVLMDHYRKPRNRGDLNDVDVVCRGSNPLCGDELEIGVRFASDILQAVKFRGRGCVVCLASASLMTEVVHGQHRDQARHLCGQVKTWFRAGGNTAATMLPESLYALSIMHAYPARRRCVLLAWEALNDALEAV